MYDLEEGVVAVADQFTVELHDRAAPEIMHAIFVLKLAYGCCDIAEELTDVVCCFTDLGGIIRKIFLNGPQIDERAPVDVSHVHEK